MTEHDRKFRELLHQAYQHGKLGLLSFDLWYSKQSEYDLKKLKQAYRFWCKDQEDGFNRCNDQCAWCDGKENNTNQKITRNTKF